MNRAPKGLGQTARFWQLMRDGKPRTIQEIHAVVGTCRLNSRVAEARKRYGVEIACWHADGTYVYQVLGALGEGPPQAAAAAVSPPESPKEAAGSSPNDPNQLTLTDAVVDTLKVAPHLAPVVAGAVDALEDARAGRARARDSHPRMVRQS